MRQAMEVLEVVETHLESPKNPPKSDSDETRGSTKPMKKFGSSGRTRTYNPPVNSLVVLRKFNSLAAQVTTHEDVPIKAIRFYMTLT
jgi:hypothetical protein